MYILVIFLKIHNCCLYWYYCSFLQFSLRLYINATNKVWKNGRWCNNIEYVNRYKCSGNGIWTFWKRPYCHLGCHQIKCKKKCKKKHAVLKCFLQRPPPIWIPPPLHSLTALTLFDWRVPGTTHTNETLATTQTNETNHNESNLNGANNYSQNESSMPPCDISINSLGRTIFKIHFFRNIGKDMEKYLKSKWLTSTIDTFMI